MYLANRVSAILASHNPYFNRWFSAMISVGILYFLTMKSHNPYFNRWFSAIIEVITETEKAQRVTILILIDGFLQYVNNYELDTEDVVTILILIDGFLQLRTTKRIYSL